MYSVISPALEKSDVRLRIWDVGFGMGHGVKRDVRSGETSETGIGGLRSEVDG